MQTTFQTGAYEHLGVYDAPQTLFGLALDGELTAASAKNAIFNPIALSPKERDNVITRMKARSGGNRVSDALIEVATNPWVWLTLATSPLGGGAAKGAVKAGRRIFAPSESMHVLMRDKAPWLSSIKVTSPAYNYADSNILEVSRHIANRKMALDVEASSVIGEKWDALYKKLGVKSGNPNEITNAEKRAKVQALNDMLWARANRMDKDWTEVQYSLQQKGDKFNLVKRNIEHKKLVDVDLDDMLRTSFGDEALDLAKTIESEMRKRALAFDDDGLLQRMFRNVSNPAFGRTREDDVTRGIEQLDNIMGGVLDGVRDGSINESRFIELVRGSLINPVKENPHYFPRNLSEVYNRAEPAEKFGSMAFKGRITAPFAIGRTTNQVMWHPADLTRVNESLGGAGNARLAELIVDGEALLQKQVNNPNINARFFHANYDESVGRYFDQTSRQLAFADEATEVMFETNARTRFNDAKWIRDGTMPEHFDLAPRPGAVKVGLKTAMKDVPEAQRPAGGFSVMDAMYADIGYVKDLHDRRGITDVLIPQLLGHMDIEASAMASLMHKTKRTAIDFADSGLGQYISANGGKYGKNSMDMLRNWGKLEMHDRVAGRMNRSMADWLYSSHLGISGSSVILNLMQPLLLGPTWLGVDSVAKGYAGAFRDMGEYIKRRTALGFREISDLERRELMEQSFSGLVTRERDLLGIAPTTMELLDNVAVGPGGSHVARHMQKGLVTRVGVDMFMMPFGRAEWFNRLVVANAVKARHAGAKTTQSIVDQDIADAVAFTQFGGDRLNTPLLFQKGPLANPLLRQFLNFPLRSLTAFHTTSRLVGSDTPRTVLGGAVTLPRALTPWADLAHAMGMSAILYESSKSVLGANLERGLVASATGDIILGRFDERDHILPIPPVLDIPYDVVTGFLGNDEDMLAHTLPRVIPGGIAAAKFLNVLPKTPLATVGLQKTYADWKAQTPDGQVPLFKRDGSFIGYQDSSTLVFRSIGADLGKFQEEGELNGFLRNNVEQARAFKKQALNAFIAGDHRRVAQIRQAYLDKFGIPLVISKQALNANIKSRTEARVDRTVGRLPKDLRPQFEETLGQPSTPPSAFTQPPLPGDPLRQARSQEPQTVPHAPLADQQDSATLQAQLQAAGLLK